MFLMARKSQKKSRRRNKRTGKSQRTVLFVSANEKNRPYRLLSFTIFRGHPGSPCFSGRRGSPHSSRRAHRCRGSGFCTGGSCSVFSAAPPPEHVPPAGAVQRVPGGFPPGPSHPEDPQSGSAGRACAVRLVRLSAYAQPIRSSATEQAGSFTFSAPFSTVKSVKGCTLSSSLPKSLY